MPSKLLYTQKALDDLACLDKQVAARILDKLDFFAAQNNPLLFAKKLVDYKMGSYRFRVGDYRVVFDVDRTGKITILVILAVKHRKDVYRI